MLKIVIKTIKHEDQRYRTCGDWLYNKTSGEIVIYVSSMNDWRKEALVAIHELCEVILCRDKDITTQDVDIFDRMFEENRQVNNYSEPGDDKRAPYYKQHQIATSIERIMAAELGVDWNDYENTINNL